MKAPVSGTQRFAYPDNFPPSSRATAQYSPVKIFPKQRELEGFRYK